VPCSICHGHILATALVKTEWHGKNQHKIIVACEGCFAKMPRSNAQLFETKLVMVIPESEYPSDSILIIPTYPDFVSTNRMIDCMTSVHGEKTIDRTKYAGRDSFDRARIGSDVPAADVRALPVDALEYELAMITSAKPVNDNLKLQVDERKEIEHKGDE
jgi:hypothetical protein